MSQRMQLCERARQLVPKQKTSTGCLLWQGPLRSSGHGYLSIQGQAYLAHRLIFEAHNGPIPPKKFILQTCGNPQCVNIEHLVLSNRAQGARKKTIKVPRKERYKISKEARLALAVCRIYRLHENASRVFAELGVTEQEATAWAEKLSTKRLHEKLDKAYHFLYGENGRETSFL